MKEKLEQLLGLIKINILLILTSSILFTFIAPLIFTLKLDLIDFTETGQIGDTIGGITAPFINVLNAILIYIAFTEQLKANNLLKEQIDGEDRKEQGRLQNIETLIKFDIIHNIVPNLQSLKAEIEQFFINRETGMLGTYSTFPELNDEIFVNLNHSDLLKIFGNRFKYVTQIYLYVNYIKSLTPLNISHKYPTDRNSLALIRLNEQQYNALKSRHIEKINLELTNIKNRTIDACLTNCYRIIDTNENIFTEMEEIYY
ncbi:hypothetical protein BOQ62_00150 [Chryseobacterium sp. CH21]|uniref:hypothetical protein n=1 Tax=Chryseobacterium sp. CH21 TaxID=713556 RepID=UPI00100BBBBD|nr:hypothetical protein [Chryseobacterium sp. CH21]RXM41479.1 hypothetical protein BOQ62_00150 [Chryseobacterium sp. CH21]